MLEPSCLSMVAPSPKARAGIFSNAASSSHPGGLPRLPRCGVSAPWWW
jgi:hypothetical protein